MPFDFVLCCFLKRKIERQNTALAKSQLFIYCSYSFSKSTVFSNLSVCWLWVLSVYVIWKLISSNILVFHILGLPVWTGGELKSIIKLVFTCLCFWFFLTLSLRLPLCLPLLYPHRTENTLEFSLNAPSLPKHLCVFFLIFLFSFFFFSSSFFFKTPVTSAIPRPFKELSRFLVCFRCLIPLLFCVRELERR